MEIIELSSFTASSTISLFGEFLVLKIAVANWSSDFLIDGSSAALLYKSY
jgi:hypothetical protein